MVVLLFQQWLISAYFLSRRYTLKILQDLNESETAASDPEIIAWVNKTLEEGGKDSRIKSFKVHAAILHPFLLSAKSLFDFSCHRIRWSMLSSHEGGARGAHLLGHRITMGAPKSPNNVTITFFNTVYLLQKDRFEHVLAKHASCPGPQITSLRPWFTRYHRFPAGVPFVAMLRGAAICSYFTSTVINVTFLAKQLWVGQCMVQKYFSSVGCRKHG